MMTLHIKQAKRTTQAHPPFGGLGKGGPTGLLFDSLLISIVVEVSCVSLFSSLILDCVSSSGKYLWRHLNISCFILIDERYPVPFLSDFLNSSSIYCSLKAK